MSEILASPPVRKPVRHVRPRGKALSARKVGRLVRIGQAWSDRDGLLWMVRQIHRKDELTLLSGPARRYVSFSDLGRDYRVRR